MKIYRIHINKNTLLIAEDISTQIGEVHTLNAEEFDFLTFYNGLNKVNDAHYALITDKPKQLFKAIKKKLTLIEAAGGLVKNPNGEFLFIFRNDRWDLPKGKVEKSERIKDAAVREVEEECGITIEKRDGKLCKSYHIYELNGKVILKKTAWYKMLVKGKPKLIPQKEEGITNAVWVAPTEINEKLTNTYPLIIEVLTAARLV